MTRLAKIFVGPLGLVLMFFLGYMAGRLRPQQVAVKETASKVHQQATELKQTSTQQVTVANVAENTKWRTRTIYYPTGEITVDREGERSETSQVKADEKQQAEVHTEVVTKVETKYVEREAAPRPRWAIAGSAGCALAGCSPLPTVELSRRLFGGPWWLTGSVNTRQRAALVGLRLEF
jgi:hypothetical protein